MRIGRITSLAALLWLVAIGLAWARPGGGDTFSRPDDFGDGAHGPHNDNDGIELLIFLVRLILIYPKLGVPLALGALIWLVIVSRRRLESWETPHQTHPAVEPRRPQRQRPENLAAGLEQLRGLDPDFSRILLEDFAYRLYASVQRARSDTSALSALAPYLSDSLRASLLQTDGSKLSHVVVGSLRIEDVVLPQADTEAAAVRVSLLYESNLTVRRGEHSQGVYLRERWILARAAEARTKPPGSYERLGCPNCGAPFTSSDHRRCGYCQQVVSDGRFNWQLVERQLLSERRTLPALGGQVEERGTDNPTVFAPGHEQDWQALLAKDPALNEADLERRVAWIYAELNKGWSTRELGSVRALVSDGMYDYLGYWVEAYRAQNLRNVLENMHIERWQRVKLVEDRFFTALTLRIFGSGLDYTVDATSGTAVSGDAKRPRRYSEYWTLIRGAEVRGAARADGTCPNCAAPLKASMAGTCAYCSAHITNGEFDWVLSKIEQDDVYDG